MVSQSSDWRDHLQQEKEMLMEEVKAKKVISRSVIIKLYWSLLPQKIVTNTPPAAGAGVDPPQSAGGGLAGEVSLRRVFGRGGTSGAAATPRVTGGRPVGWLDEAKMEVEAVRKSLAEKATQVTELQQNIRMLMEKNNAKQEVRTNQRSLSDWPLVCHVKVTCLRLFPWLKVSLRSGAVPGAAADSGKNWAWVDVETEGLSRAFNPPSKWPAQMMDVACYSVENWES